LNKDRFRQWLNDEIAAAQKLIKYYETRRDHTIALEKIQTNRASRQVIRKVNDDRTDAGTTGKNGGGS